MSRLKAEVPVVADGGALCTSLAFWWFGAESGLLVLAQRGLLMPAVGSALKFLPVSWFPEAGSLTRLNFGKMVPSFVSA